jgi:hypothetical protein
MPSLDFCTAFGLGMEEQCLAKQNTQQHFISAVLLNPKAG